MSAQNPADPRQVDERLAVLKAGVAASGYHLNPDDEFTRGLIEGLLVNEGRYGYGSCPCRLASGKKAEDLDIVCPCDYRDADVGEWGSCFCALYVSEDVMNGSAGLRCIPERRPSPEKRKAGGAPPCGTGPERSLPYPVWRCKVCGYLCAREEPPGGCPICKAGKERFERFM